MGEGYVKETQNTLGKVIKKPPMTEKLLIKPPFRFLHDIITEVIRTTGFMKGLYSDSDLDSKNVRDKESKIVFLQKAIDTVAMVTSQSLSVRPSKVVAGHEPEKTNEFLQAIAKACHLKPDSSEEVKKVLKGEKPSSGKPPRPRKDEDKKRDKSSDKREREKDRKEKANSDNRSSSRDKESKRDRSRDKDIDKDKDSIHKERSKDRQDKHRDKDRNRDKDRDKSKDRQDKHRDKDRNRDREKDRSKDGQDKHRDKDRNRDKDRGRSKDGRSKDKEKSRNRSRERLEKEEDKNKMKEDENEKSRERDKERERKEHKKRKEELVGLTKDDIRNEIHNDDEGEDLRPVNVEGENGVPINRIPRPSSAKGQRRRPMMDTSNAETDETVSRKDERVSSTDGKVSNADGKVSGKNEKVSSKHTKEEANDKESEKVPLSASRRLARPSSARPAPPRLKKQESVEKDESRVGSGKQVSNVIVDNAQNSDEDESFVVEETQPLADDEPGPMQGEALEEDGDHGGLVKKILETKKELEGNQNEKQVEKPTIMDAAHRKQRELVQREVEKLRGSIQTLTRSADPLGKIMDYLQEDVDSMQKELEMWKKENHDHGLAIKREQSITDSELEPLQAELSELEQSMVDQVDKIAMMKANILRNDDKITKMMGSIAFS